VSTHLQVNDTAYRNDLCQRYRPFRLGPVLENF
jgi:hypothetical protein